MDKQKPNRDESPSKRKDTAKPLKARLKKGTSQASLSTKSIHSNPNPLSASLPAVTTPPVTSKVVLDVGGVKYTTSRSTLLKETSMLTAMFSGSFALSKSDDGSIFLDRDGEMFKYILVYLRDGLVDASPQFHEALLREARYFQLTGMVQLLKDKADRLRSVKTFFPRCHTLDTTLRDSSQDEGQEDTAAAPANLNPPGAGNPHPANANAVGAGLPNPRAHNAPAYGRFTRMQWSGNHLVLGTAQGSILVYNLYTNNVIHELRDHTDSVRAMAMKDNLLVSGGRDLKVKAWDLVSGEVLFSLAGDHKIMITSVQFKDDYLVSASLDGTVIIWDMWKQKQLHTLSHNNTVFSVSICGSSRLVIECGAAIYIHELATGKLVTEFKSCELVHVVDDQPFLIYYSQKPVATFSMWDLEEMELLKEWKKVNKPHVEVSAKNGNIFATGSEDGEIQVYDLTTGKCLINFPAHISFVGLQIVNHGVAISGAKDGKVFVWDISTGQRLRTLCHSGGLFSFKFDMQLLICGYDAEIRAWDFRESVDKAELLNPKSGGLVTW